ncbi:O-antigen ligase family protein [Ferrimonas kyonanensis]|uniref:O-antigen ligase family protein n=1 Tax=Ferrimonas kyonanensis TaxID=364763 RepID=UPI000424006E|nr:O-antigen ligase family protein [Ferrimonas kyonanensis]
MQSKVVKPNNLVVVFLVALFSPIIGVKVGATIKAWMLLAPVIILISPYKWRLNKPLSMFLFGFACTAILSLLLNLHTTASSSLFFLMGIFLLFLLLLSISSIKTVDFETSFNRFCVVYIVITTIYYAIGINHFNESFTENNITYYGIFVQHGMPRLSGLVGDPNLCAFYFSVLLIISLSLRNHFISTFCVLIIILTGSRTAFAFLALLAVIYLVFRPRKLLLTIPLVLVLVSFISTYIFFSSDTIASVESILRIGNSESISQAGGRMHIWKEVLAHIAEQPLQISGFGSSRAFTESVIGTPTYFHNTFLELTFELGILVTTAFILVVLFIISCFKSNNELKIMYIASLMCFGMSLSLTLNEVLYFSLFALYLGHFSKSSNLRSWSLKNDQILVYRQKILALNSISYNKK